jgi:hypothetical protein
VAKGRERRHGARNFDLIFDKHRGHGITPRKAYEMWNLMKMWNLMMKDR